MFTGIISSLGEARFISDERLRVYSPVTTSELSIGESIAVNGICLTASLIDSEAGYFECDISPETRQRTTLGEMRDGQRVNLELSMAVGERFGGHLLQGHVDSVAELVSVIPQSKSHLFTFRVDPQYDIWIVEKGSLALDGISLTPFNLKQGQFEVAIIPHTYECTTLQFLEGGDRVNVEFDILAKYVQKQLRGEKYEFEYD